jgi:hypothetical protein
LAPRHVSIPSPEAIFLTEAAAVKTDVDPGPAGKLITDLSDTILKLIWIQLKILGFLQFGGKFIVDG